MVSLRGRLFTFALRNPHLFRFRIRQETIDWSLQDSILRLCEQAPNCTWTAFSNHYAKDHDPGLPYISPLYADLRGLPPVLIYAGGDEILLDDAVHFVEKAKEAGVDATLRIGKGLFHCYPVCAPLFPEATQAMNEMCGFIKMHVTGGKDVHTTT